MPIKTDLMPKLIEIVTQAGNVILEHYESGTEVWDKEDRSPVTAADRAAELVILAGLRALGEDWPIVAEEEVSQKGPPEIGEGPFWLVDPLDGTKEFLSRNGEFTVNIALIDGQAPAMGVVFSPALGRYWWGIEGEGASCRDADGERRILARRWPGQGAVAVASRSHRDAKTDDWLKSQRIEHTKSAGSSLKLCLLAEGEADVYPRFGRTMEWDIAAGHAVLAAAGGTVICADGTPFRYGKKPVFDNPGFIAWADAHAAKDRMA